MGNFRNFGVWLVVILLVVALFNVFGQQGGAREGAATLPYSEFIAQTNQGNVAEARIDGERIVGRLRNGANYVTIAPPDDPRLIERLEASNAVIRVEQQTRSPLVGALIGWLPLLLLVGVWIFFMRQMQSGGRNAMGFGNSRAKLLTEKQGRVTFDDVAGVDEAKEELQEIVEVL